MSNEAIPEIDILYEDADCAIIDKPSGLMVHPDGRAKGPFLTDWVIQHFPEAMNVGEPSRALDGTPIDRPGIVHRLDRETSGALIIAKTAAGHASLKQQFKDRTIKKRYLAFVWGQFDEEFGTIDRPIGRSGSDFRKWSAQRGARGDMRDAETYWSRIGQGIAAVPEGGSEKFTLVEAEPKTGRTHQIRVHFTAVQHPVVGDSLYAPKRGFALGFTRTALHAYSVEFDTLEGKRVKVTAPLPADFIQACKELDISETKFKS
jgi:23S rRNA pseudouridine1911/1915/1917 synthase